MAKTGITPTRLSRRDTFRLAGAAGAAALVGRRIGGAQEPACVVTPALTEGPYFVDERLNRSDIRSDPGSGAVKPGIGLAVRMRVYRIDGGACTPLTGATVDLWHCDALGLYSDIRSEGTAGQAFLRGYQVTDESGAASFTTIYPGWYRGRAVHVHFKVRLFSGGGTAYEFTSQFFFNEAVTDAAHAQAPYNTRGWRDTLNSTDGIFRQPANDGTGRQVGELLTIPLTTAEQGYAGTFDIGLRLI